MVIVHDDWELRVNWIEGKHSRPWSRIEWDPRRRWERRRGRRRSRRAWPECWTPWCWIAWNPSCTSSPCGGTVSEGPSLPLRSLPWNSSFSNDFQVQFSSVQLVGVCENVPQNRGIFEYCWAVLSDERRLIAWDWEMSRSDEWAHTVLNKFHVFRLQQWWVSKIKLLLWEEWLLLGLSCGAVAV